MINKFTPSWMDKLTPRQRLSHKLRDGKYRALMVFGQVETQTIHVKDALFLIEDMTCYYCGTDVSDYYELEHKTPFIRGGRHELSNLVKACGYCNEYKGSMTEDEYRKFLAGGFSEIQEPQVERMN